MYVKDKFFFINHVKTFIYQETNVLTFSRGAGKEQNYSIMPLQPICGTIYVMAINFLWRSAHLCWERTNGQYNAMHGA